MMVITGRNM